MADFAHSLPRTQPSSKKSSNGNGFAANVYEDVFGGASKFGIPTFTSRVEDYSEIFSSYNSSSRGSSIPFLDLPVAVDDETDFANARCSKFDYNEIFGGFDSVDYAVPYEQLFLETKASAAAAAEAESSSEDVWTPAGTGSPSEESSEDPVCSESNQTFSNIESHYAYDGAKQYNVSYHKTNQTSKEDVISGTTHIAQLNAVPAYTFVVDENLPLQTAKCDNPLPEVANDLNLDPDIADWKMDGEHFWETKPSQPACVNDQEPQKNLDLNGASNRKPFITITEINLRTQPCEVPPPSRPPPKLTIKQGSHKDLKSSEKYARQGKTNDSAPTFFDVEVDISSSAAASAAAMKEAMQKAEARLKSAKEMMERKKDGLQHRKKMGIKEDSKGKEKWESRTAHDVVRVKEDKSCLKHERKDNDLKVFDREEKQKGIGVAQAAPDLEMKPSLFKASDGLVNKKQPDECRLTQEPQREEVIGEWKAEEQFYELVKKDTSGTVLHTPGLGKSEMNSIPITRVYEHGEYEKKAEKLAYEHQEKSDGNSEASKRTLELEEDIKRLNVAKEIWERAEHEDKMKAAQKFCDQEEQERRQVEAHALEESEKKRKEVLKQEHEKKLSETHEHEKKAREREEYEKKLQEAHEREEHEKKLKVDREREENEKKKKEALYREENERRQRETREREENERRQRETREREENEKKQEALEREENERRRKEAQDNERRINEKKLEEARQREESEKRQKEIREREENEKRLSESRERQENERRLKQAAEDNEKRLKELREREENERRVKEVCEREENERRLKEVHEREENERRLKEVREKEENERRLEEVREREESERREREESERRQKEEHEREESERRQKEEREREESERRQKEEREREESEKRFQEFYEREENERKLKQAAEENEMRQKEVHESEEREKIRKETLAQEENARRLKTCEEVTAKLFQKKTCERVENEKKLRGAQDRDGSEMRPETVFEKITESDKNMKAGNDTCMQDDTKNTEANSGDPEQENNNTKLKSAQESRASEGYGEAIESATSVSDHSDIVNNLKENEVSSEEDKIVRLRAAHSSSTSYGHEECKDHQIGASNAKVDNSEKKSEKIEDTVRQEKDKTCTKEGLVALDCKDKNNEEVKIVQSKVADEFNTNHESKKKNLSATTAREVSGKEVRTVKEKEHEKERLRKFEEDRQREKEREKDRMAVERVTREARERAYADARERAERAAVERATAEARQRAMTEARERLEKACAEAREKSLAEKAYTEARLRAERAAVERATAEARERAVEKAMAERAAMEAKERVERSVSEKFSATSRDSGLRQSASFSDFRDAQFQNLSSFSSSQRYPNSSNYAAFAADKSQGNEVESAQRCKARLERHQRTVERAAKALAEKNLRDYQAQREQTERNRLAETLDADVKRWSSGKEGNLRALLSTLQYILGPESHWQPVPLTEVITAVAVKRAYRKATLCVHPDKLQQRGASIQQKYICEKVFDLLKDAWNKFNSEER